MKILKWIVVILAALILVGCEGTTLAPSGQNQAVAGITPPYLTPPAKVVSTSTVDPNKVISFNVVTLTPTVAATPRPTATPTLVPMDPAKGSASNAACSLADKGIQMLVDSRIEGDWRWDPAKVDSGLQGCAYLAEGRKTDAKEHHIWVLGIGPDLKYLGPDGLFHCRECSVWAYPAGWNMGDFSSEKPPISAEFVNAKSANMKANNYSWPIFVHLQDGVSVLKFEAGVLVKDVQLPNNCTFEEQQPRRVPVTGIYDPKAGSFNASVGAEGCRVAVWVNGSVSPIIWTGARDNFVFKTIVAYMLPGNWTEAQVKAWADLQNPWK